MLVDVLFFDEIEMSTSQKPSEPPDENLSERKFILLEVMSNCLIAAVGPWLKPGSNDYLHEDILQADQRFDRDLVRGGGRIKFEPSSCKGSKWQAVIHGFSGDFGVYDPRILEPDSRSLLQKRMGMNCHFIWEAWEYQLAD